MLKHYFYSLIIFTLFSGYCLAMETPVNDDLTIQNFTCAEIATIVGPIKELKYNTQGDKVAVIGKNCNFAQVFDINNKKEICGLYSHIAPITCIAWHPDSTKNLIITGSEDNSIKLWDATKGTCIRTFKEPRQYSMHKSPIKAIAFADGKHPMFLAGNEAGLPFIRLFTSLNYKQSRPVDCLGFKGATNPIYHASFHLSGTLACIASTDGVVKIFARPSNFNETNHSKWECKLQTDLDPIERLESVKFHDQNYLFLKVKNMLTNHQVCALLKIELNDIEILEAAIADYCELTNKFLNIKHDRQLFEFPFAPEKEESRGQHIFTSNSTIKSTLYNATGTQIIVTTDEDITILDKKNDKWRCVFSSPTKSHIILHPTNNDTFVSISSQQHPAKDNIISIWESAESWELDESDQDVEPTQSNSLKRDRNSAELDKSTQVTKCRKTIPGQPNDNVEEYASTEEYSSEDEEEEENYQESNSPSLATATSISEQERRENEIQTLLGMYELVTVDPDILNKSLLEVVALHSDDIIKKFLAYKLNDNLDEQDDQGRTALFAATDANRESTVKLLAEQGADVNIANFSGFSPLHVAIQKSYIPLAYYLIACKALINKQTIAGETPLHMAVKNRDLEAVEMLLASSPDLSMLDRNSNSPLSLVIASKNPDLIKIFGEKLKRN